MKAIKVCVLLLVVVSVFMVFGCGGAEKNAGATQPKKVFTPDWYGVNDNPDYIYVYGSAEKLNANISEEAAKGFAYSEAAQYVEASVKTMLKNFISESGVENPEVVALTENVTKVVASTKFSGTQVSKRESYTMENGKIKTFIRLSIPKADVNKNLLDKIKNEEALYNRFRASQSFQELDKELSGTTGR